MARIILPYPHNGQQEVIRQLRRWSWISAGRRWRKTTMGVALAVEKALKGRAVGWGAPTYDQVRIAWDETYKAAGGVADFRITRGEILFPTGGKIFFRSLDDADNARGHTADDWIFDEVGDIRPQAYYEVVYPMLIENSDSTFMGIGTPKGRNFFWREWSKAKSLPDAISFQIPTVGCEVVNGELVRKPHPLENPEIPFSEIERMFSTTPASTFKQEILAEFLENEGQVFRNIAACMKAPADKPEAHKGHRIVIGGDWGKQNDFTALSAGCTVCKREVERDRFNQIDYNFQIQRLAEMYKRWNAQGFLGERNAMGDPILEQLPGLGIFVLRGEDGRPGFNTSATTKPPLVENLSLVFERTEWQFQQDEIWTAELEAYERTISPATGRSSYSAPEGMHDDTVMARALMLWAVGRHNWIVGD